MSTLAFFHYLRFALISPSYYFSLFSSAYANFKFTIP